MRSIDVTDSIEIKAPPSKIFNTVINYPTVNHWFAPFHCTLIDSDKIYEGCKVKHRYSLGPITLSKFIRSIDKITPHQQLDERYISGDLIGTGTWRFHVDQHNPDVTITSYHCQVRANNLLTNIGFMFNGAKSHSMVYQKLLRNLKRYCEQEE